MAMILKKIELKTSLMIFLTKRKTMIMNGDDKSHESCQRIFSQLTKMVPIYFNTHMTHSQMFQKVEYG